MKVIASLNDLSPVSLPKCSGDFGLRYLFCVAVRNINALNDISLDVTRIGATGNAFHNDGCQLLTGIITQSAPV
jgi:hypothetical protein